MFPHRADGLPSSKRTGKGDGKGDAGSEAPCRILRLAEWQESSLVSWLGSTFPSLLNIVGKGKSPPVFNFFVPRNRLTPARLMIFVAIMVGGMTHKNTTH